MYLDTLRDYFVAVPFETRRILCCSQNSYALKMRKSPVKMPSVARSISEAMYVLRKAATTARAYEKGVEEKRR